MSKLMSQTKNQMDLVQLEFLIKEELDLDCQVLSPSIETPVDTLVVKLETDEKERIRIASIMFIPLNDSDFESLKLLQFYCETPVRAAPSSRAAVTEFLSAVNLSIPVGTFCLTPDHLVACKYVCTLGKFREIEPKEFLETFLLWMFAIDSISGIAEMVAEGKQSLADAIKLLEQSQ
jgi:hypothetical protein